MHTKKKQEIIQLACVDAFAGKHVMLNTKSLSEFKKFFDLCEKNKLCQEHSVRHKQKFLFTNDGGGSLKIMHNATMQEASFTNVLINI